jgi:hypothetical protein
MSPSRVVRSFKNSGMQKYTDGGVPSQGVPQDYNSTYPFEGGGDEPAVASLPANDGVAPTNTQYRENMPSTIAPLGRVDLGPVSQGGKE